MTDPQPKWNPQNETASHEDWVKKQQIERDILLLFHQLSEYTYIMGDLYWGDVFALPYWEYLDLKGLEPKDRHFIQEGCLVMLLAMAWERIDGVPEPYIPRFHKEIRSALDALTIETERRQRLLDTVKLVVAEAGNDRPDPSQFLINESNWVHQEFVGGYFKRMSREFPSPE